MDAQRHRRVGAGHLTWPRRRRPASVRYWRLGGAWQQKAAGRSADRTIDRVPEAACSIRGGAGDGNRTDPHHGT